MERKPAASFDSPAAKLVLAGLVLALLALVATGIRAFGRMTGRGAVAAGERLPAEAEPGAAEGRRSALTLPATPELSSAPLRPQAMPAVRPAFTARDARLAPGEAFLELRQALDAGNAPSAARFVLDAKLLDYGSGGELVSDLRAIDATGVEVAESRTRGDRAIVLVSGRTATFTDAEGRPLTAPAVVRMAREAGRWKLFSQVWLVNTSVDQPWREALAWLGEDLGGSGPAAEARRRLASLGLTADDESLRVAAARQEVENVRLLLAAGVSPNARDGGGMTAWENVLIGLGAGPAFETMAIAMVSAGADLRYRTPTKMGPLALAVSACNLGLVEVLLQAGVSQAETDVHGLTPRRWADQSCPAARPLLQKAAGR